MRAGWREAIEGGITIDESADILFAGMAEDKLYIGPRAFAGQDEAFTAVVRGRIENIMEERNPQLPPAK